MKHRKRNIAQINRDISRNLLDSFRIIEILEDIADGEAKTSILLRIAKSNLEKAFKDIEHCRKLIYIAD